MGNDATAAASPAAGIRAEAGRLRVGLILDDALVAWQALTMSRIAASLGCELAVVVSVGEASRANSEPALAGSENAELLCGLPLARFVRVLESGMECDSDAFERAQGAGAPDGVARIRLSGSEASGEEIESLRRLKLDVLVDLRAGAPSRALAPLARYGLWWVNLPYCSVHRPDVAAFWPVYHRWPVTECEIQQIQPDGRVATIARTHPATNPYSVRLNRTNAYWRVSSLLVRELERLQRAGQGPAPAAALHDMPRSRRFAAPTAAQVVVHMARNVRRRAQASVLRRLTNEQWILLFRLGEALSTSPEEFTEILPPPDRFWADPHVVSRDGRYYVFFEELKFASGKGEIAVIAIDSDGSYGPAVPVLQRDYHLSYPFVFEDAGELFMVPESEANRTVDLYRCVEFPAKWERVTSLMRDVVATDSTLLRHDGRWWMFTNLVDTPGASFSEELFLFHSETLTGGTWKPHARNPVVSDARRARPAGAVLSRNGRLYRPAQDCSVRYGHAIRLHEITRLTETEYEEKEVATITPTWNRRIVATHTLSYTPGITLLDALRPRLKAPARQTGP